jgi:chromosome segregation ATPase
MGNVIDYITALLAEFFGQDFKTTEQYADEVESLICRIVKDESNDADLTIGTVKFSWADLYPDVKEDLANMIANKQAKAIHDLMKEAKWIPAIRELRSVTGLSLKDSKLVIDEGKNGVYRYHFQAKELELTKQRNQDLMEDLQSTANKAIELQSTVTDLRLHSAKLGEQIYNQDKRIKELANELDQSKDYNAKLHHQQADTSKNIRQLRTDIVNLHLQQADASKNMRLLREDLAKANAEIDKRDGVIKTLQSMV